jgi:virginiamycin A acetyltransferase
MCQIIASNVAFVLNGSNYLTDTIPSYSYTIFRNDWQHALDGKTYPNKGNTVIVRNVWMGNGAIVTSNTTATKDVVSYTIVGANHSKLIMKRFYDSEIDALLQLK